MLISIKGYYNIAEGSTPDEWWNSLTKKEQIKYKEAHPRSKRKVKVKDINVETPLNNKINNKDKVKQHVNRVDSIISEHIKSVKTNDSSKSLKIAKALNNDKAKQTLKPNSESRKNLAGKVQKIANDKNISIVSKSYFNNMDENTKNEHKSVMKDFINGKEVKNPSLALKIVSGVTKRLKSINKKQAIVGGLGLAVGLTGLAAATGLLPFDSATMCVATNALYRLNRFAPLPSPSGTNNRVIDRLPPYEAPEDRNVRPELEHDVFEGLTQFHPASVNIAEDENDDNTVMKAFINKITDMLQNEKIDPYIASKFINVKDN